MKLANSRKLPLKRNDLENKCQFGLLRVKQYPTLTDSSQLKLLPEQNHISDNFRGGVIYKWG